MLKTIASEKKNSSFRIDRTKQLCDFKINTEVVERVPEAVARQNNCLPIYEQNDKFHFATATPDNLNLKDKLRFILNRDVEFHFFPDKDVQKAINKIYGQIEGESADSILQEFNSSSIDFTETCDFPESQLVFSAVGPKKTEGFVSFRWLRRVKPSKFPIKSEFRRRNVFLYSPPRPKITCVS